MNPISDRHPRDARGELSPRLPSWTPRRVRAAIVLLHEAHLFAQDLGQSSWEFAIELPTLRRLGLTDSDLRWLVAKGLARHALEITLAGEEGRAFRKSRMVSFSKRACFTLAEEAADLGNSLAESEGISDWREWGLRPEDERKSKRGREVTSPKPANRTTPRWDRDRQELRLGESIVKRFKSPAANQLAILTVFEEEGWPPRIDDPLPPRPDQDPKRRLHDTINSLNRNRKLPLIRFFGDGSGQGVRWELITENL